MDVVSNDRAVAVFSVRPGGEADRNGVRIGDQIIKANADATDTRSIMDALLESELRTRDLKLEIARPDATRYTVELTPRNLLLDPSWLRFVGDTAVLNIQSFTVKGDYDSNFRKVMQAHHDLVQQAIARKPKRLIIDLRSNEGGDRYVALSLACAFVNHLEVTYKDTHGVEDHVSCDGAGKTAVTYSDEPGKSYEFDVEKPARWTGPIAILVSRFTASAAENFTDALQSQKRAIVVGEPSSGARGTSGGGRKVLLNGATLYYPERRIISTDGKPLPARITPDILVPLNPDAIIKGRDEQLTRAISAIP
jgi:carboxyl-terminal processing protease